MIDASSPHPPTDGPKTRLAPSPTGALHLGNIRTFLINAALARAGGWRVVLRIEDLDGPRVKPEAAGQTVGLLGWLGFWWDEGPTAQSDDLTRYTRAMGSLAGRALAYPCELSRKEIELALSAPHDPPSAGNGAPAHSEPAFPRSLRPPLVPTRFASAGQSWRFAADDREVEIADGFSGTRTFNPARSVGDFPIWTKAGVPSYQLAVVVDDAAQGITHVVRGDDLLDSAARQTLLAEALGLPRIESYVHVPLVVGEDGKRLAKRHGDTRLLRYRAQGVRPERVIGLCAAWCGITDERSEMSMGEFIERFDPGTMSTHPVVMRQEDDRWLTRTD